MGSRHAMLLVHERKSDWQGLSQDSPCDCESCSVGSFEQCLNEVFWAAWSERILIVTEETCAGCCQGKAGSTDRQSRGYVQAFQEFLVAFSVGAPIRTRVLRNIAQ